MTSPSPKPSPFVWPPASAGQVWTPPPTKPLSLFARVSAACSPLLLAFERDWLGVVDGSWTRRAREASWVATAIGDYCSSCGASWDLAPGLCRHCDKQSVPWQRCVRLGEYEGVLRQAILECKHASGRALGEQLGAELGVSLLKGLELAQIHPRDVVIVPVPMSLLRWMSRGRDHTLALCRGVKSVTGSEVLPLLARSHRPLQTGTTLEVRKVNVRNSMRVRKGRLAELQTKERKLLVIVDDVMTSGATMREAVRALEAGGLLFSDEASTEGATMQVWTAVAGVTHKPREPGPSGEN